MCLYLIDILIHKTIERLKKFANTFLKLQHNWDKFLNFHDTILNNEDILLPFLRMF